MTPARNDLYRARTPFTMYFLPNDPRARRTDISWCADIVAGDVMTLVGVRAANADSEERTFFSARLGYVYAKTTPAVWEILTEKIT